MKESAFIVKTKRCRWAWTLFFIFCLYIFFYNPFYFPTFGILGRGMYQQALFLLWIAVIVFALKNKQFFLRFYRLFQTELFLFLFLFFLTFFHFVLGGSSQYFIECGKAIIEIFFVPCFIIGFAEKKCRFLDKLSFMRNVFIISSIAAIITLICVTNPSINTYVRDNILKLGYFNDLNELYFLEFRCFGLAESLSYSYGILQGFCFALGVQNFRDHKWFIAFMPLVLVSAILNARTGVIVGVVGLLPAVLEKGVRKYLLILFILFIFFALNFEQFLSILGLSDDTLSWISLFFEEMNDVRSSGNLTGSRTTSALFDSFIVLPSGLQWLVGSGQSLFGTDNSSDMGFILQLNYGGLFYCIPLYFIVFHSFIRLYRIKEKAYAFLFVITFLIANIKGNYLPYSGIFRVAMLLYYYLIFHHDHSLFYSRD